MKKKLFGAIAFVAIAVAAGWNVQQNNNKVEINPKYNETYSVIYPIILCLL